jgi:putative endonuclease
MQESFVYILSNKSRTSLYIGVTANIFKRIREHKSGEADSFTKKYNINQLMYFEKFYQIQYAIAREKQLKNWHKEWKWNLIKEQNPQLIDLAVEWH